MATNGTLKAVSYLSFRVGEQWYGVPVDQIIEVLHLVALNDLPGSSPDILGLLTRRETIMPVVDLRMRFGLDEAPLRLDTPIIAVQTNNGPIGLVVDDFDDIEELTDNMEYEGAETPHVRGAVKQHDRLLMLLDTDQIYNDTRHHIPAATASKNDQVPA